VASGPHNTPWMQKQGKKTVCGSVSPRSRDVNEGRALVWCDEGLRVRPVPLGALETGGVSRTRPISKRSQRP